MIPIFGVFPQSVYRRRLTAMDGEETLPRISPDGNGCLSATQFGNRDIFCNAPEGAVFSNLPSTNAADDMDSWAWNSKIASIFLITKNRYSGV